MATSDGIYRREDWFERSDLWVAPEPDELFFSVARLEILVPLADNQRQRIPAEKFQLFERRCVAATDALSRRAGVVAGFWREHGVGYHDTHAEYFVDLPSMAAARRLGAELHALIRESFAQLAVMITISPRLSTVRPRGLLS
jgi:hypothetical protein